MSELESFHLLAIVSCLSDSLALNAAFPFLGLLGHYVLFLVFSEPLSLSPVPIELTSDIEPKCDSESETPLVSGVSGLPSEPPVSVGEDTSTEDEEDAASDDSSSSELESRVVSDEIDADDPLFEDVLLGDSDEEEDPECGLVVSFSFDSDSMNSSSFGPGSRVEESMDSSLSDSSWI